MAVLLGRVRRRLLRRESTWRQGAGTRPRVQPLVAGVWMVAAAATAAAAIWVTTAWLLGTAGTATAGTERARVRVEAVRTGLAAGAGVGAAIALMLAFRRQQHQEIATALTDHDAAERRITELYTAAADQLGSDKAPVRLAGLYTLERLAQDNPGHRQTIVSLICAYLRMPYTPPPGTADQHRAGEQARQAAERRQYLRYQAARSGRQLAPEPGEAGPDPHEERQVRLTAQRILAAHLHANNPATFWTDINLDLTGATLLDFDLTYCTLAIGTFTGASFAGATRFDRASFTGAAFFTEASFAGATMFARASFAGGAFFARASFAGRARFDGASFAGGASFFGTSFAGGASFVGTSFAGGVSFDGASFAGGASFFGTSFVSGAYFDGTSFAVAVDLSNARVGDVSDGGRQDVWPPGWRVEPAENGEGQLVRDEDEQQPEGGPEGA